MDTKIAEEQLWDERSKQTINPKGKQYLQRLQPAATERVKGGERSTIAFLYDGDGLRTQKKVESSATGYEAQVTRYLYDRQYVILETDAAVTLRVRYVRGINYIS